MARKQRAKSRAQVEHPKTGKRSSPAMGSWLLRRTVAVLLGTAVGLLAAEIGLRVLDIRPPRYAYPQQLGWDGSMYRDSGDQFIKRRSRFEDQGVLMGEYIPNARFKIVYATNPRGYFDSDGSVLCEINAHGLRGADCQKEKPPGTFRILGIGDSFTFGVGVREEDTFLRRIETQLNENRVSPPAFEVLNAGVQGYNTRDEVTHLEHQWLDFDPDLILIGFYLNDAYSDHTFLNMGQALGIYQEKPEGLARISYLIDLGQHTYHARQMRQRMDAYYRQHFFMDAQEFLEQPGEAMVDWGVSRNALEHAVALASERDIAIALVIFPELHELEGTYPFEDIHRLVIETCNRLGLPVIDLLPTFRGHQDESLWVHPSDHHPNEVAHRLAATAIVSFLEEQGLLSTALAPE